MTEAEALRLCAFLNLTWPQQAIAEATISSWWAAGLRSVDYADAIEGVSELARVSRYMPTLAEILEAAGRASHQQVEQNPQMVEGPGVPPPADLSAAVRAMFDGDKGPLSRVLAELADQLVA